MDPIKGYIVRVSKVPGFAVFLTLSVQALPNSYLPKTYIRPTLMSCTFNRISYYS